MGAGAGLADPPAPKKGSRRAPLLANAFAALGDGEDSEPDDDTEQAFEDPGGKEFADAVLEAQALEVDTLQALADTAAEQQKSEAQSTGCSPHACGAIIILGLAAPVRTSTIQGNSNRKRDHLIHDLLGTIVVRSYHLVGLPGTVGPCSRKPGCWAQSSSASWSAALAAAAMQIEATQAGGG